MSANQTTITAAPGQQDMTITREFDAPRELVFKAFTDPQLFVRWIGPRPYIMNLETFEPVSGGRWRYIHAEPDGSAEYAFHGVFHEVLANERIIQTFEFEGMPESGHVTLETAYFQPLPNNRTRLVNHSVFMSVADRDGMIQSGMEGGMNDSYAKLDEILAEQTQ